MNATAIRAGIALLGTAAALGAGAFGVDATASAQPTQAPAAATSGAPSDQAVTGRAGVTFLTECVDDNRVSRPTTFTLACADDNQKLERLVWQKWGHHKAHATGVVRENVSEPMSKGDRVITYPVTVTATDVVDGEATSTYTKLVVRTVGTAPPGVERVQSFDLPGNSPIDHGTGWTDGHEDMSEDVR